MTGGDEMLPFEAVDNDAGKFGEVDFSLSSENDDHTYFAMRKLNRKQSQLILSKAIEGRTYTVGLVLTTFCQCQLEIIFRLM